MANVSFRLTTYQIGKAKRNKVVPDMKPLIFVKISLRNNRNRKFDKGRAKKLSLVVQVNLAEFANKYNSLILTSHRSHQIT